MKVIFLDFDGVITTVESKWRLSPPHMEIVKKIIDKTGAKIVISSSWRFRDVEHTLKGIFGEDCNLENCNFLLNTKNVIGVMSRKQNTRGAQISAWLLENPQVTNYVILDDDNFDILPEHNGHLVQTHTMIGITNQDADLAIEILND